LQRSEKNIGNLSRQCLGLTAKKARHSRVRVQQIFKAKQENILALINLDGEYHFQSSYLPAVRCNAFTREAKF